MKLKTCISVLSTLSIIPAACLAADVTGDRGNIGLLHELEGDYSTISGGVVNTIDGYWSTIAGGAYNSLYGNFNIIGGGTWNFITANVCTIGGGDINWITNGHYVTIAGGKLNIANGYGGTIGGGEHNLIHALPESGSNPPYRGGTHATIGGGAYNLISSNCATISGGNQNNAAAEFASVGGGQGNVVTASYGAVPGGLKGAASHYGQMAFASGQFANVGDAQSSLFVLRQTSNSTNKVELFLDGAGQRMTLPVGATWGFEMMVVARSSGGNSSAWTIKGVLENVGGTTAKIGTVTKTALGEDATAWALDITADNTYDCLSVKATGDTSTIRWVASVRTTEVIY
jgi:hypothetical protein